MKRTVEKKIEIEVNEDFDEDQLMGDIEDSFTERTGLEISQIYIDIEE